MASAAWAGWTDDLSFSTCYARSFTAHTAGVLFTVSIPLKEWSIAPLTSVRLNADMNGAMLNNEEFQGGPGLSATLKNQLISFKLGVGYVPGDLGGCWYLGLERAIKF
jgi:hypothetical protein